MYKYFFLFLFSSAVYANEIKYAFSYVNNTDLSSDQLCLHVMFTANTDERGEFEFYLPSYSKNYLISALKESVVQNDSAANTIKIKQQPNSPFTFSMDSCYPNQDKSLLYGLYLKDIFYLQPRIFCPIPKVSNIDSLWKITYDFTNMPNDFIFSTSLGVNERIYSERRALRDFGLDIIIGSKKPTKTILVNNKPVNLTIESQPDFLMNDFESKLQKLLKYQRDFFNDNDFKHYYIYSNIINNANLPSQFMGRHFNNILTIDANLDPDKIPKAWMMIGHEMFHAWLGKKIAFPDDLTNEYSWFVEGISDYYGHLFAYQTKLVSKQEYIDNVNFLLQEYFGSPLKNISNKEAISDLNNFKYYRVLTLRGHIIGLLYQKKLDAIIKSLYRLNKKNPDKFKQIQNIDTLFIKYLGHEAYRDILNFVTSGEFNYTFFKKKPVELPVYQFNYHDFVKNKIIKDLVDNSPEYNAGLRNDMQVVHDNLTFLSGEKSRFIIVKDQANFKKIEFMPEYKAQNIPQL